MPNKEHWENIYEKKSDLEVSWYQESPTTSLQWIEELKLPKESCIIDVGAGNSNLTSSLHDKGFSNLWALDISANALERTKAKFSVDADKIQWLVSDILNLEITQRFSLWHDRAVFHFLTQETHINRYAEVASNHISPGGYLLLATFSTSGPKKCSGLDITQYSELSMQKVFEPYFSFCKSMVEVHNTPSGGQQNFIWCLFQKDGVHSPDSTQQENNRKR
jgi:2-polyprenyl-3-methyl-5-hydroxy-6-metoxy-1,4-benzoquinol methylase